MDNRNTVKSQATSSGKPVEYNDTTVYVNSDRYFNESSNRLENLVDGGFDVQPVDIFGGFVPQDKSLSNLKKTEAAIRSRFDLGR